jgi:hypothetical protein
MDRDADLRALQALSEHPQRANMATLARSVTRAMAETRCAEVAALPDQARATTLTREQATTPFGNALDVIERGPRTAEERALARALAALALRERPPETPEDCDRAANDVLWLGAHTAFDATPLLDEALGTSARPMWSALGHAFVAQARREPDTEVRGELARRPRGAVATALLALTGISALLHLTRLLGRLVLTYRTPAVITCSGDGSLRVAWRVELLGKTLREQDVVIPPGGLSRASREVRYPALALYAGLLALALGSLIGVSALMDGIRAASPALFTAGLAIVAFGIATDFVLSSVAPGARGRCRLLLVPKRGGALCIGDVDLGAADRALLRLAGR